MEQEIITKFVDFCNNGHTPLTLQKMLKKGAQKLKLESEHLIWFEQYIHRVRDIVCSEPGHQTLYAFRNGGTFTSYSLQKKYKKNSHASYRRWLTKLDEIKLLCRYDQEDDLKNWGKKKVYAINPKYFQVTKIIISVISQMNYAPTI